MENFQQCMYTQNGLIFICLEKVKMSKGKSKSVKLDYFKMKIPYFLDTRIETHAIWENAHSSCNITKIYKNDKFTCFYTVL